MRTAAPGELGLTNALTLEVPSEEAKSEPKLPSDMPNNPSISSSGDASDKTSPEVISACKSTRSIEQLRRLADNQTIKDTVMQQCISAIYDARSLVSCYGAATYSCKAANSLEAVFKISKEVNEGVSERVEFDLGYLPRESLSL